MLEHSVEPHSSKVSETSPSWMCHHCNKEGHIKPFCYKLYGYPSQYQLGSHEPVGSCVKKVRKPKCVGLIAHTSLTVSSSEDWYFDSGYSRHMTGVENFLDNIKFYTTNYVTFGDGARGEIVGISDLVSAGLPRLDKVLLVKGLTTNLISISQLCDKGLSVNFSKSECLVTDKKGKVSMKGIRSKDNCYMWLSQEKALLSSCLLSKEEEVKLWHQKLGHLNLQGMNKAIYVEAIRGLPKLNNVEGSVCGECQVGKQTRMSHSRLEHQGTSKVLELLHMDLMGPMQVSSIGGNKYVLVVVDDFSRFTWVNFIREKSDTFDAFRDLCTQLQREKDSGIVRILKYINGSSDYGILYSHSENTRLVGYGDANWAGSVDDRESTSGGCFFLGNNLVSWFSKKQNFVALSIDEAEYIAAGSSCSQLVWMKQMLQEYDVKQGVLTLYCDNLSAIKISKNPIQHSRTKHIDIRHPFIMDLVEDKIVTLEHVTTEEQLADIFTKALDVKQFEKLRSKLGICAHEEL